MRTLRLVAALSLLVAPTIAYAQQSPPADSVPRAGEWAAEVVLGSSSTGATLLRFRSPHTALLFGADFSVSHSEYESDIAGVNDFSGTFTNVAARLGVRSYRQSTTERLRPVAGFGARGGFSRSPNDSHAWNAGIYGEIGAVYFVASHLSLGAIGELQATYAKQKQDGGAGVRNEATTIGLGGSTVRFMLSVYF